MLTQKPPTDTDEDCDYSKLRRKLQLVYYLLSVFILLEAQDGFAKQDGKILGETVSDVPVSAHLGTFIFALLWLTGKFGAFVSRLLLDVLPAGICANNLQSLRHSERRDVQV